jgi:hypothetical protein
MISKKNRWNLAILVLVLFSVQVVGAAYPRADDSPGKKPGEMSKAEKAFYQEAWKLIDGEKYKDVIELSNESIRNDPANAMYHQFKGMGLVLKYADDDLSLVTCGSCIKDAVQEFHIAAKLDPANEDRALAGVVLAHVVDNEIHKAGEVFEPVIKKYSGSIHLNYVGIKYYEMAGDKSSSLICKNFVAEKNPEYEGKPVFAGLTLIISVGTLVKMLTAAVIISYIAGFKSGMKMKMYKGGWYK